MNVFGYSSDNIFDQSLNTDDSVEFASVTVTDAISLPAQLATKLYVDTHGGGSGNMTFVGGTPATNYLYKGYTSDGLNTTRATITDDGSSVTVSAVNGITAPKIIKTGGTNIQYLMGDGSTLTQSATSGNSNFYLYQSKNGVTTPPPLSGDVGYNNANQSLATIVYISHLTRDNIDIEVFYNQVNQLSDLYIQDQNNSVNFIKYNITGLPTPVINSYTAIPVLAISSGGTGATSFGSNNNVLLAFFSNLTEVDTRLSTLETATQNQTAVSLVTTFNNQITVPILRVQGIASETVNINDYVSIGTGNNYVQISSGLGITSNNYIVNSATSSQFLKGDGTLDSNTYVSEASLYNPTGLGNIDIMLRDSPFIGLQYNNGTAVSTLSNSAFSAVSSTAVTTSTYGTTNNFTRQLCCANWTTISLANGAGIGYISNITNGCRVSSGFNFGLSAVLGISDTNYNANNCQNFWGVSNLLASLPLDQSIQLSVQRNIIGFGSDTNDPNICIYTGGASNTVKQVDLGSSFPANRPTIALGASTDFFKFTLYWEGSTIYYKAVNTTTHVIVSGSFIPLATDMPLASLVLFPQCIRIMGSPQVSGQAKLQVQRFGVYYN